MDAIKEIISREVLDSRGFPTVEAQVILDSNVTGRAIVPSGASTGSKEAIELRDNDLTRYNGKGVLTAVKHITKTIAPALKGKSVFDQKDIDSTLVNLDGTPNKEKLGANAILAVSLACAVAAAKAKELPLYAYIAELAGTTPVMPTPLMNILNGGAHADNSIDVQEFMVIPAGMTSFADALRVGCEVYHSLKSVLKKKGMNTNVGDEGGFAPNLHSNEAAIETIMEAIAICGLKGGKDVFLGLDVAASELYKNKQYYLAGENKFLSSDGFIDMLSEWVSRYPIISIEDAMDENDWDGWKAITERLGDRVQLIGDDLFVTNTTIFKEGISQQVANAILIKLNQIGTLTETLDAISLANQSKYNSVISHRSGETEDSFIADFSAGLGVGQIKTGAPARSDRTAKYNQLLRIEQDSKAHFAGASVYQRWLTL